MNRRFRSVSLKNLIKRFGTVVAVNDLSLEIAAGEFLTLLGPSGSGKTTLLRIILGIETLDSGTILVNGDPIDRLPIHRRNIGMVFQNYALFPHMTVAENLAFPLKMRHLQKDEIAQRLEAGLQQVRLDGYGNRYARQLSGGQQQRVAMARALVARPDLLLMDEPLGALDKQLREDMQQEVRELHQSTTVTMVYVTHDQGEAMTMSDRIAVLNHGKLEQVGTPKDLYENPRNSFVAGFLGNANLLSGRIESSAGNSRHRVVTNSGMKLLGISGEERNGGPSPTPGDEVQVLLRPEKISVLPLEANAPPTRPEAAESERPQGQIRDVIYMGSMLAYRVTLEGNQEIRVHVAESENTSERDAMKAGDRVLLSWDDNDSKILTL